MRRVIESIDDTCTGRLDLEQHGGRTRSVLGLVLQRVLALTTAICTTTTSMHPSPAP